MGRIIGFSYWVQGKIDRVVILFCFYGVETLSLDQSWYSNLKKITTGGPVNLNAEDGKLASSRQQVPFEFEFRSCAQSSPHISMLNRGDSVP
jgi:hypothetical protein